MFVCNCHGLSDRDVRAMREQGITKAMDMFVGLGVGRPQCGKCVNMARAILAGDDQAACDHTLCLEAKRRGCGKKFRRAG